MFVMLLRSCRNITRMVSGQVGVHHPSLVSQHGLSWTVAPGSWGGKCHPAGGSGMNVAAGSVGSLTWRKGIGRS
jgi:hypothetical protein